jgi:DNA-binding NarL/FixJ family response regulator
METTKVKVDDIKFNKGSYPRFEADNATVNQYRDCLSQLPPILVSKDLTLVDGYHRLLAHRLEKRNEISVEFFLSNDPKEILLEAIRLNSLHGRQLSQREKRDNCLKLWDQGLTEIEKLLKLLSVDLTTINRWTKDKRADAKKKEEQEILELYLQGYTFEEISQKLDISMGTVSNVFKNMQLREIEQLENLQFYNVWNVGKLGSDQMKFPGQTPIDIVENIVYYYTEPPTKDPLHISKVVDPMAGSGIVRDVCRKLLRRYQLFDVKPLREDIPITQNNILEGFPEKAKGTDLVYFDPPYYNLMEEYPANDFNKDYPSFLDAMTTSLKNITTILNQNGKVALILKPMNEKMLEGEWFDLTFDCVAIAKKEGYKLVKRISAPLSTQQFTATDVTRAKEHKVMLNTLRDIVIFGRA